MPTIRFTIKVDGILTGAELCLLSDRVIRLGEEQKKKTHGHLGRLLYLNQVANGIIKYSYGNTRHYLSRHHCELHLKIFQTFIFCLNI